MTRFGFVLMLLVASSAGSALAQNLTVQQPSVSNFSVGTTVVVPDNGGAFLGGVKRGAMGRSSYGPFRSGSALGLESSAGGMSAHVQIHDMAEMDRQVLNSAAARDETHVKLPSHAEHAWQAMKDRPSRGRFAQAASSRQDFQGGVDGGTSRSVVSVATVDQGQAYLAKGRTLVAQGKVDLAKVYFRMADKLGIEGAKSELALANQKSARTVTR